MLLAFESDVLEHALSAEEHSQILQTIEMFEAITQTQPEDYQSLEILREAYTKVGRHDDALRTSRKLAEAYFNVGSYTPALQQCEMILAREPNAPEILAMLGEIEQRVQASNKELTGQAMAVSMLEELCKAKPAQLDAIISALIDRTKFAYVPLEYYDTDRQIAPMLPETLTLGRLFVPFDLVSRTIMVACCNPFDSAGRDAVQQSVDYTVSWYLARPSAIVKTLQSIYRLESRA